MFPPGAQVCHTEQLVVVDTIGSIMIFTVVMGVGYP